MNKIQLIEQKKTSRERMRAILDKARDENRDLSEEESSDFDAHNAAMDRAADDLCQLEIKEAGGPEAFAAKSRPLDPGVELPGQSEPWEQRFAKQFQPVETPGEVRALRRNESAVDYLQTRGADIRDEHETLTLGGLVKAMATGKASDAERRALAAGTDSLGGFGVPSLVGARVIDRLRDTQALTRAGANTIALAGGDERFLKIATDPSPEWRLENADVASSDPSFEAVTFSPQTLAVVVPASRELLQDASNAQEAIERSIIGAMAQELDRVGLLGTGTAPEPKGIVNTSGIASVAHDATITDYDVLVEAMRKLLDNNAGTPTAFLMSPREWEQFNSLVDTPGNAIIPPPAVRDVPFIPVTKLPTDGGAGNDESSIITGDFTRLTFGVRSDMRIEVLNQTFAGKYQTAFLAAMRVDVQLEHPSSFCEVTGVTA